MAGVLIQDQRAANHGRPSEQEEEEVEEDDDEELTWKRERENKTGVRLGQRSSRVKHCVCSGFVAHARNHVSGMRRVLTKDWY